MFLLLSIVFPIILFYSVNPGALQPIQLTLRCLIILYSGWMLALLLARGETKWFATMFWTFCFVWMGIAGMAQTFSGRDSYAQVIDPTIDTKNSFLILCGMIGWHFLYNISTREKQTRDGSKLLLTNLKFVSRRRVLTVFWIAIVLTPLLLAYLGDFQFFLKSRIETASGLSDLGNGSSLALQGIIVALIQVPPAIALFGVTLLLQESPELRRRPAWWVTSALILALNFLVNNPIGVSRFWFGTVIIGWILCWRIFRTVRGYRLAVIALVATLTIIFPYADYFRTPDANVEVVAPYEFLAKKLDYDASAQVSNAIRTYETNGPAYGHQLLGAIGFAVPRSVWPDKAEPTGVVIAQAINFHFENLSAPLWAEGYVDFGPIGAPLYPALFGILAGVGDRLHRVAVRSGGARVSLIATPALALYSLILIRGSLLGTVAQGVILAVAFHFLGTREAGHQGSGKAGKR